MTGRCNALCEGCVNTLVYGERLKFSEAWDSDSEENLQALKYLIQTHNGFTPIYIALYGGEPLLAPEKINFYYENLRESFPNKKLNYILFTNGMLLDTQISKEYKFFEEISLLIVSIDGQKEQHEKVRRGTVLEKIEANLAKFKEKFSIPVLMWSTIRENMRLNDCTEEFLKLYNLGLCDCFFWHLIEADKPIENFLHFRNNYVSDLKELNQIFIKYLEKGKILPILPLCEVYFFLLKGIRRGHTGCGIERLRNFDIVSGKILPCVDLGDEISLDSLNDLEQCRKILNEIVGYRDTLGCRSCFAEFYCGGRCPVLVKVSPQRARQYCILMRDMIDVVKSSLETVKSSLRIHGKSPEELYFPYGYLVLLTDVVP